MARIFMYFGQSFGMLSKLYPVICKLVDSGHTVKYVSLSQIARRYLEPIGVYPISASFNLDDRPRKIGRRNFYSAEEHYENAWFSDMDWILRKINELEHLMDGFNPDFVIESWGPLINIIAKIMNIKCVSITHGCYHPERLYDKLRWWDNETREIPSKLIDNVNEIFKNKNVSTLSKFEELFTGDYTLIPSVPKLDPIADGNCYNTYYVAPMLWDNHNHLNCKALNFNADWPTIFCYTGKLNDGSGIKNNELLHIVLKAFANNKINLLLTLGLQDEVSLALEEYNQYSPTIANIAITTDVSISEAFNMSDMVIHHGGYGSCIGQLAYARASVMIPTNSEREYHARLCEKLGLGISIPIEDVNLDIFRDAVFNVLKKVDYTNKALECNTLLKDSQYPTADEFIIKLLNI
jgi:UDP:flavonoid glycosyltransferase YjiC (YdhE family)